MGDGAWGGVARIVLSSTLFVISGLMQTVCMQAILYSGGGDRSTYLVAIPNYFGIAAVYFIGARAFKALDRFGVWTSGIDANRIHTPLYMTIDKRDDRRSFLRKFFHPERHRLFVLAFNELGGFLTGITGLSIAGSGLYQVVFSGATVFTALLSTFFLRKRLTLFQWTCLATITAGLMITAEQVTHTSSDIGTASLVSGILFILLSCLFYSSNYVIAELLLDPHVNSIPDEDNTPDLPPPSGLDLSLYTGGSCFCLFTVYVLLHTVPQWNDLVTNSIHKHHGHIYAILLQYLLLMTGAFFHALSHYDVVATIGAVPVGVLNALRAVSVFGASSAMFCSEQASQCYNSKKGIATAIVILGASGYSFASMIAKRGASRSSTLAPRGPQSPRRWLPARNVVPAMPRSISAPFLDDATPVSLANEKWSPFSTKRRKAEP